MVCGVRGRPPTLFWVLICCIASTIFLLYILGDRRAAVPAVVASMADIRLELVTIIREELTKMETRVKYLEDDSLLKKKEYKTIAKISDKAYPKIKLLAQSEKKRILVTGGAGFVGSHLVDRLMVDGHEVTVIDNFFTGRKSNLEQWIGHENFELRIHDIVTPMMIEVDEIYHLASPASPVKYMFNPIKTIKTNVVGTLNMLGLAKRVKAKLLLASTSEVYGDPKEHPQTEEYWGNVNPIGPRACYDEGKRLAETMVYAYAKQENVEVRVARIFNTYGPKMHMFDGRVVSNFIIQALQGKPLTVSFPGNQTRSFMYVSDLVRGLILLMNSNYSLPVNLGNPDEHTILEFAQIIQQELGVGTPITMIPSAQDDPRRRKPDITKAKNFLNWHPTVPLRAGIRNTVKYFKTVLNDTEFFSHSS
ncbi:hypothetical protein EMCRGX_G026178 [Ephydatia muelleri]